MTFSRRTILELLAASGAAAAWPALAQSDYPSKPIRYIVPYSPGGITDVMARLMAPPLADALKQSVVVENKAGANANIGADYVAKAAPDGYTWLGVTLTHAVNPALFPKLSYSIEKDLLPVAQLATSSALLVVNADSPAKTLAEFLALAKSKSLNGGSSGSGSVPHLGLELLNHVAKIDTTHIPYKGGAPSMTDLLGGQIDFIVSNLPVSLPYVKAGKLRALAVTSAKRDPLLPEVPTFAELGLHSMELGNWTGLMMPAGTPAAIVEKVAAECIKVVNLPDVNERIAGHGHNVTGLGPAEFGAVLKADIARWREVVKARNITA